jgi:hypothetical protein
MIFEQRDGGTNAMRNPRERLEHANGIAAIARFPKNGVGRDDHRIRCEYPTPGMARGDMRGFFLCCSPGERRGGLMEPGNFGNVSGYDLEAQAQALQQLSPSRGGGRQDER